METINLKLTSALLISLSLFFYSCKKDSISTPVSPVSSDEISEADAPGIYTTPSGNIKLVLQPGNDIGQDAWIEYSPTNSIYATHNSGPIDQFKVLAWTDGGTVIKSRTLIRFNELSKIPSTSKIQQATLFLYGLDEDSIDMPQGNSYYPGSPYKNYGPNDIYVQKITSPWDESSVTWNTMPKFTVNGESLIPPSQKQWNNNSSADVSQIVRAFVKDSSKNYGFILTLANENIYHSMGFYSSENSNAKRRPKLTIIYSN